MESADDVRASLAVAPLGDLRPHEATSPDGESRVADLLGAARVLSWPLVVDAGSGLILDGSHRAVVLARDFGARFAVIQRVDLDSPDVRIGTWCRVLEDVPAAAFDAARRALGLVAGAEGGLRCHYGDRVYGRSGPDAPDPYALAERGRAARLAERPPASGASRRGRGGRRVAGRGGRGRPASAVARQADRAPAGGRGRSCRRSRPASSCRTACSGLPCRSPRSAGRARLSWPRSSASGRGRSRVSEAGWPSTVATPSGSGSSPTTAFPTISSPTRRDATRTRTRSRGRSVGPGAPRPTPPRLNPRQKEVPVAQTKFLLDEKDLPSRWYNIQADLPAPLPPVIHPGTLQPIGPQDLAPLFPMEIIKQEVSQERWIDIPEPVRDVYRLWRPTPLYRAHRLEKALGTPARIYYKWEGVSPAGSHKPNTAVPQAYYNHQEGVRRITTETGAGQWGSALSFACQIFGIECKVYMVRVSYDQKPYRRIMMEAWGGKVVPSPSTRDGGRPRGAREGPALAGQPRHGDLGGGRGGCPAGGHEVLARLGAEPRPDAPDGHRAGGPAAARDGGRPPRHPRRLHRGRLELRRVHLPLPPGQAERASGRTFASSPSSPRRPRASPRASTSTTSATPGR